MSVLAADSVNAAAIERRRLKPTAGTARRVFAAGAMTFVLVGAALTSALLGRLRAPERVQTLLGRLAVRAVHRGGGAFVKIAQILATRADLFDAGFLKPFASVHDRLPPVCLERLLVNLPLSVGDEFGQLFSSISPEPFARGSVAQVYRAESREDGAPLAVKIADPVKRRETIVDILIFKRVVRQLQKLPGLGKIPLAGAFHLIARQVVLQFDMRREARFHRRSAGFLQGRDNVMCPRLRLAGRHWLAMDFLPDARRVDDDTDPGRRTGCLLTATRVLFEMIFQHGVVHGDFHPGNILIDGGGRLVILDFGLAFELTRSERRNLGRFFMAIVTNNPDLAAEVIVESASNVPAGLDGDSLRQAMADFLDRTSGKSAGGFALAGFTEELFAIQSRHGIVSTTEFALPMLALLTLEGSLKRWSPSIDFQREALPYVVQAL